MKSYLIMLVSLALSVGFQSCSSKDEKSIATEEQKVQAPKQLYTCGMHPDIVREEPGNCPICGMKLVPMKMSTTTANTTTAGGEKKILYYKDPMHPWYTSDQPGKAPDCGMDLVPVYEGQEGSAGVVRIDPAVEQNINVKIGTVERKNLASVIHTTGHVGVAEPRLAIINTKISGWVEKLYVNYLGQSVTKNQKLMEIYSPQLVSAQQELVTALDYDQRVSASANADVAASGKSLIENAKRKLILWDIDSSQIEDLMHTRTVQRTLTVFSPANGVVLEKNIIQGQSVSAGQMLLKIADLSTVWLHADLYEYELVLVHVGQKAIMRLPYVPGKQYEGRVAFVYPTLDPKARTGRVRIDFPNPRMELKPEMFAQVDIETEPRGDVIAVPEQAVIRTGTRDVVIVALGEGRFEPRNLVLGIYADGFFEVKKNLYEGERILLSSQFLIDSESNLRSALNALTGDRSSSVKDVEPHEHEMTSDSTQPQQP